MSPKDDLPASGDAVMETTNPSNRPRFSAVPKIEALSPLGTLSRLPRELRDEIYRWGFANQDGDCRFTYYGPGCKWNVGFVSLLRISSTIRQEALETLRTHGVFELDSHAAACCTGFDEIPFVQYISHLTFFLNVDIDHNGIYVYQVYNYDNSFEGYVSSLPAGPLTQFTGQETLRNTFEMRIHFDSNFYFYKNIHESQLSESPLAETVSRFTGFRVVTLKIEAGMEITDQEDAYKGLTKHPYFSDFTTLTTDMIVALEPTLGQCEASDVTKVDFGLERSLVFHPQAFLATKCADNEPEVESESLCESLKPPHSSLFGILSRLPRELRDQIYRLCLEGEYFYEPYNCYSSTDKTIWRRFWKGSSLSLLVTSNQIRQEALHALGIWSTFVFVIDLKDVSGDRKEHRRYVIPFVQSISNIQCSLNLDVHTWSFTKSANEVIEEDIESTNPGPLVHFTGNEILRNTCNLLLWFNKSINDSEIPAWPLLLFQSKFGQVIAQLTGFTTFILGLDLKLHKEENIQEGASDEAASEEDRSSFAALTSAISTLFELSLGPSSLSDILTTHDNPGYHTLSRQITFQPQALATKDAMKALHTESNNTEVTLSRINKSSSPKPAAPPSSLGSLSRLPREVRNQIYHSVMGLSAHHGPYIFYGSSNMNVLSGMPSRQSWYQPSDSFLPLLQTSSMVREEALDTLRIHGDFKFHQDLWEATVNIPFLENISNVKFDFELDVAGYWDISDIGTTWKLKDTDSMSTSPLAAFTGNEIIRKSCVIEISSKTTEIPFLLKDPLNVTIAQLTVFKSVTLSFKLVTEGYFHSIERLRATELRQWCEQGNNFLVSTTSIAAQFESTLGPGFFGKVSFSMERLDRRDWVLITPLFQFDRRRDVVFHPQAFLASKLEHEKPNRQEEV